MTTAVCLRCGTFKFGAFTPCPKCSFLPESPEDQAKAIALSDHHLDHKSLKDISKRLAAGERLQFDEQAIAEATEDCSPPSYLNPPPMFLVRQIAKSIAKSIVIGILTAAVVGVTVFFLLSKLK